MKINKILLLLISIVYFRGLSQPKEALDYTSFQDFVITSPQTILENINSKQQYQEIEINRYAPDLSANKFQNEIRFPITKYQKSNDVLSKVKKGIGSYCRPANCQWYLSIKTKKGSIKTINTPEKLKKFLGEIENPYEAWLLLSPIIETLPYVPFGKYLETEKGFIILIPLKEKTHSESFYTPSKLYIVTFEGTIREL